MKVHGYDVYITRREYDHSYDVDVYKAKSNIQDYKLSLEEVTLGQANEYVIEMDKYRQDIKFHGLR
ncbi:hypothetical protein GI482_00335 [Bacillus sp. N3536]|nr:hypothetical protein GI482_00335 [Bacillus sp. N3536]